MNRPGKRTTVGLTAILLFLPNAFWKSEPPRQLRIRFEVRAAEGTPTAPPAATHALSVHAPHRHTER